MYCIKSKKLIGACVLVMLLTLFGSCKKLLDFKPVGSLTKDEFFKTEADANAALAGVYDGLQACVVRFWTWGEGRGDLVNGSDYVYQQQFDNTRDISKWSQPYLLIGRANVVISDVPQITKTDAGFTQDESNSIVGQARFLRALAYFYLVRSFKEVPLVLEAPNNDKVNYIVPKSTADEVLDAIEDDLAFAAEHVPVQHFRERDTRGMATKAAVNALQTEVFLWRGKYSAAAEASKKVLDNTQLYSLLPGANWFNMFSQKNSSESIFEVQFDYTLKETNGLTGLNFSAGRKLIQYFTEEKDVTRGEGRTYATGGAMWKYRGFSDKDNILRPTADPNFIIYRLADVILMRAEALVHLDDAASKNEALRLLNLTRVRANLEEVELDFSLVTVQQAMDLIMKERAMELGLEGKRWFDLVRLATNDNRPQYLIDEILASRGVGERALVRPRIIDARSWYLPIHTDELKANPKLVQNPYYPE